MKNTWLAIAAVNGFLAVAFGAFGAHGLKQIVAESKLAVFQVGVQYQMYHALALLAVAWLAGDRPRRLVGAAGICMLVGILLFSGSLYALTFVNWRWLGPVTPVGGLSFLAGWFLLGVAALRSSSSPLDRRP